MSSSREARHSHIHCMVIHLPCSVVIGSCQWQQFVGFMSLVTAVSSSDIATESTFESIFPVLSSEAEELIARIPSTSSPSHLVLRRRELAVNSHEYSATTMRLLVKAQGEVYPREVREVRGATTA